jgi:hypothetical protein
MARSWQYPRWRRMLMQIALVLILAGTAGLAELVTRQRNQSVVPELKQSRTLDGILVKLPTNWVVNDDDADVLIAREPRADEQGRILLVRVQHVGRAMSAEGFLRRSGLLNGTVVVRNEEEQTPDDSITTDVAPVKMQSIMMAGQKGVMAHVLREGPPATDMSPTLHSQLIATAVLPSRTAIVLQLDSMEPDVDGNDAMLVEQIAAAMEVTADK